jgi:hypothetical protein
LSPWYGSIAANRQTNCGNRGRDATGSVRVWMFWLWVVSRAAFAAS